MALAKVRLFRSQIPLFVEWNLTFRCNLRCQYCGAYNVECDELDTEAVRNGLDTLWKLGTRWVTFGGGEPLLRKDIDDILAYAKEKGFQVYLSTNGILIPKKRDVLRWVDHANLSLDGGRDVHDAVRGKGSFDKVIEALHVCREIALPVSLQCVLSSHNLDCVDEAIGIASEHAVPIMFQPATKWLDSSTKPNPIAPPVAEYRKTIAGLIERKKQGAPVRNSVLGLRHLAHWPDPTPIWCSAGRLTATIEPDGAMLACHQCQVGSFLKGARRGGDLALQFREMPRPKGCVQCWCAPVVELALLFTLRPRAVLNALRMFL